MSSNPIQYLKHGKALCGNVFKNFVETFNWHTSFCLNMKGDGDYPASKGKIHLDRTNNDFPIIRCEGCDKSDHDQSCNHQCFDIDSMDDESVTLRDCYYSIGGKSYGSASMSVNQAGGMILSLKVSMSGSPSAELACHSSIAALNSAQQNDMYYIRPLYWFDSDMKVKLDFRNMPDLSPWEFE